MSKQEEKEKEKVESRKDFLKASLVAGLTVTGISAFSSCSDEKEEIVTNKVVNQRRFAIGVDLNKCIDCEACAIACKTENDVRLGVQRSGVIEKESGTSTATAKRNNVPWLCNHCDDPICITNCLGSSDVKTYTSQNGEEITYNADKKSTFKRPDGLVLIDQDGCVDCGNCVRLCPYGARYSDPARQKADKCDLCVHRLDDGALPACVATCQAEARYVEILDDTAGEVYAIKNNGGVTISSDKNTKPMVYYSGIDQATLDDVYATGSETLKGRNKATKP